MVIHPAPSAHWTHLIVENRGAGRGEGDGGDSSDEVAHVVATLHLGVSREGPHQRVDQVARDILLQLVMLWGERGGH